MIENVGQLPPKLYLASKSPRRQELLRQIGVPFSLLQVDVPEQRNPNESAHDYVQRLAQSKAMAGCSDLDLGDCVLGADTIVVLGEQVLEKPSDREHCLQMLSRLSGSQHEVYTAVAVACGDQCATALSCTRVRFRYIEAEEMERYWATGEPADKAGAYGIQGLGAVFVESIEGSYSNVVGLPLFETQQLLCRFGIPLWQDCGQ